MLHAVKRFTLTYQSTLHCSLLYFTYVTWVQHTFAQFLAFLTSVMQLTPAVMKTLALIWVEFLHLVQTLKGQLGIAYAISIDWLHLNCDLIATREQVNASNKKRLKEEEARLPMLLAIVKKLEKEIRFQCRVKIIVIMLK